VTGDELKLGRPVRLRVLAHLKHAAPTPLSGARAGQIPSQRAQTASFHCHDAALLGAIPIAIPTPMITSDTKITARSIVSHVGMSLGCSFTGRILHTPFG
jgi:hypothetical protein